MSKIFLLDRYRKKENKPIGCCSKHWLPAGELCNNYTKDTGGGILMKHCSNCWYFNNRSLLYKKIEKSGDK